jgi:hypothetical protein
MTRVFETLKWTTAKRRPSVCRSLADYGWNMQALWMERRFDASTAQVAIRVGRIGTCAT